MEPGPIENNEGGFNRKRRSVESVENQIADRVAELADKLFLQERRANSSAFPAKTCRDLQLCHPAFGGFEDGNYIVDPNGGSPKDQISVFCNFTNQATCIRPKIKKLDKTTWQRQVDPRMKVAWFAEDLNDNTIEYEIDDIQLSYLQLLSNNAQQMFTFKCKNSVAWYDETKGNFKKAVKFEGASGHEFSSKSKTKRAMIKVPHDGCKVKDGSPHDTQFVITTTQASRLPIVDFAVYDLAGELEVEIGEVCFW